MDRHPASWLTVAAALFAVLFPFAPARAQTPVTIPVETAPVIRMQMRSGTLTIRTWDRAQVQISSSGPVEARRFDPIAVARALHGGDIPIFAATVLTPNGPLLLPPEEFFVPSLMDAPHDGVVLFAGAGSDVTVTVPSTTALIWAMVGHGSIRIQDYRSGAFVARVHGGSISLSNVGGDAYVEAARGPIQILNSAFNRIRARTAVGDILFENCNTRQVEASSIAGSIAYDNGTFVPGLARFETTDGDIALGVAGGGAQIAAHSSSGRVYSGLDRGARVEGSGNDARAIVGGGGPVVTANSQNGSVYLYNGAFKKRPQLQRQWRGLQRIIKARTFARPPYRV